MINRILIFLIFISLQTLTFAQNNLPLDTIEDSFKLIKTICDKDNGKLWGKSLWSATLVIDRDSRMIIANEPDNQYLLTKKGNIFVGKFPESSIIANSTTEFGGKHWTMVAYPLPTDTFELTSLFIHEMFHRLQKEIGLSFCSYDNSHMDKMQARLYLKLELLALLKAINSKDKEQKQSITDAILFRQYRRSLFPGCDSNENSFEIGEGLANYTALKLCCNSNKEIISKHNSSKDFYLNQNSFVRVFGYHTGSLYAFLLDESGIEWRKKLDCNSDLALLLKNANNIEMPKKLKISVEKNRELYGYKEIYDYELNLKIEKDKKISEIKNKFTKLSVLKMKLQNSHFGFDPTSQQPIDSIGTYFPFVEITDDWGVLKVDKNGCIMKFGDYALVPSDSLDIKENEISGDGWILKLNEKWKIEKIDKNYLITKK